MRALFAVLLIAVTPGVKHTPAGTAAAHRALIRHSDLGAVWTTGATPKKVGSLTCATSSVKGVVETGSAVSPTFSESATGPFVSQSVYVYNSAASAAKLFARVSGTSARTCLAQSFTAGDPSGKVTFTAAKQQALPAPKVNGRAVAYRVSGRAAVSAQRVGVYVDIVLIQQGNTIALVSYASFLTPVPASVELRVARAAAGRL